MISDNSFLDRVRSWAARQNGWLVSGQFVMLGVCLLAPLCAGIIGDNGD